MAAKKKKEERAHAILSASASERWLICPPSARLAETFPETTSEYAEEGTLAHAILELKIKKQFIETTMTQRSFNTKMNKLKKHELYKAEMDGYTTQALDFVTEIAYKYKNASYVASERKVAYSAYAPEGFGTVDCIIISGNDCHIIDFKYGKGVPVYPDNNAQLSLYALGVIESYKILYNIQNVYLSIMQPRLDNFSTWETTAQQLITWGNEVVKPAAQLAFAGEGEYKQGEHCRFCPAAGCCRERAEANMALQKNRDLITGKMKLPPLLTNDEVGKILKEGAQLVAWYKKLESYAKNQLLSGNEIKGYKLVEGRSNRAFVDADAAMQVLIKAGYEEAALYDRVPLTLTDAESLVGKKEFAELMKDHVVKPPGAPTMAPAEDKRPVYQLQKSAEEMFGGDNAIKEAI